MGKVVVAAAAAVIVLVVGLASVLSVATGSGSGSSAGSTSGAPGSGGLQPGAAIPSAWLTLYQQAAAICPGLAWSVVAAVGTVESRSGQSTAPGVWSGANSAGAEGPMQFEPATFAAYATVGPGGARPPSPYDPVDSVYTASALLCADGAASAATLRTAIDDYNHASTYVDTVLTLALSFQQDPSTSGTVVAALDCSGLAQAAYRTAGITLPRVAQDQFDAGPVVPAGAEVAPGDLVFFGSGPTGVEHVGLYVGAGEMIDAPHTGALVRFDVADQPGLVGATRPG